HRPARVHDVSGHRVASTAAAVTLGAAPWRSWSSRRAHNAEIAGSSPAGATPMGFTQPVSKGPIRERVNELRASGLSKRKAKKAALRERHPRRVPVTPA